MRAGALAKARPHLPLVSSERRASRRTAVIRASGGGKTDIKKQGLNSVPDGVVKNNLMGVAPQMQKKGWVDAQGRKGKVRFV